MAKKILYFEEIFDAHKEILEQNLPEGFEIIFWKQLSEKQQMAALKEAEFFLIVSVDINDTLIRSAAKLRQIQRTGIGVNNVDVECADACGVVVSNLPLGNAVAVAEHAILLPLALYRKLIEIDRMTKNGEWPFWRFRTTCREMNGKVHGFIGMGNIGCLTAMRSKAFETTLIYYDVRRLSEERESELGITYCSLDEVIRRSDILSLHVPLTKDNVNMIGKRELNMMKPDSLLINVSRGGLIDEKALYDALVVGKIAGAGIDTWADEPNIKNNPLLKLDNVIATAHTAAGTIDTFHRQIKMCYANIVKADKDKKPDYIVGKVKETK